MPDPDLPADPRQSIRFAHEGRWDEAYGASYLAPIDIAVDAPGEGRDGVDGLEIEALSKGPAGLLPGVADPGLQA